MGERMYRSTLSLTSALVGGEWSASHPGPLTAGEKAPSTDWIEDWVNSRAGLDGVEKRKFLALPGLKLRPLGRPARGQSLYRQRYPGSWKLERISIFSHLLCSYIYIVAYLLYARTVELGKKPLLTHARGNGMAVFSLGLL
jgi:hypothetical protein